LVSQATVSKVDLGEEPDQALDIQGLKEIAKGNW